MDFAPKFLGVSRTMGFPEWSDDMDTFCCDVVTLAMLWIMSEGRVTAGKTQLQLESLAFPAPPPELQVSEKGTDDRCLVQIPS